jgi:chromosomal replication initiation ATPase DnaA
MKTMRIDQAIKMLDGLKLLPLGVQVQIKIQITRDHEALFSVNEPEIVMLENAVCEVFGVQISDFHTVSKKHTVTLPKHLLLHMMYMRKEELCLSVKSIAMRYGLGHANVYTSSQKIEGFLLHDVDFKSKVEILKTKLIDTKWKI